MTGVTFSNTSDITVTNSIDVAGPITLTGTAITVNHDVISSTADDITLSASNGFSSGTTTRRNITSANGNIVIEADADANGSGVLNIDYLTFDAGSGDLTLRSETVTWVTTDATTKPWLNGTGAIILESNDASLGQALETVWYEIDQDADGYSGLTIGKSTNVQNVTINTAQEVSGAISIYGGVINVNDDLISTATSGTGINIAGQRIIQDDGIDVTTSGADMTYTASGYVTTGASESVIVLEGDGVDRAILDANGGDITFSGSYGAGGVDGTPARAMDFSTADIITSGSGQISLTIDATNNPNTTNTAWGMQPNNARVITDNGAITLDMTGGAATGNSRGLALDANSMELLSTSGSITIIDREPDGLTGSYNGLYLSPSSANAILFGADGSSVANSSSDVLIQADRATFTGNTTRINSSGVFSIEPISASFGSAFTYQNINLESTASGLTLGKSGNTANITLASAVNVNGPVEIYGGDIAINENLTSTGAGSDVLLKGSGSITLASSTTLQTNNGDLILWSDSDVSNEGHLAIGNDVTLNSVNGSTASGLSTGGNIVLAGGADDGSNGGVASDGLPDGFARSASNPGIELSTDNTGDVNFYSGGGNINMHGYSSNNESPNVFNNNGINQFGGLFIDAGTGRIRMIGEGVNLYGINLNQGSAAAELKLTLTSAATSGDAIYIRGVSSSSLGLVFNFSSNKELKATAGGDITLEGVGGGASQGIFLQTIDVLANTGTITLDGGTNGIFNKNTANTYGFKAGSDITSSSSDIIFRGNAISVEGGGTATSFNTTGTVTLEPYGTSFTSALSFPISNLSLDAAVSGLTLGKASNTAAITIAGATTIAGPISVYGGDIAINENLNTSAGAAAGDVLLKASGNVNLANTKSITTDGGDVTYWADSDGNDNGYVQLGSSSSVSTSGGNITLGGGSDINTGYARGNSTLDTETEPVFNLTISGVHLKNGTTLTSDGGNITLRGKNLGSSANNLEFGILGHNATVNSGSGKISMEGIAVGSGSANTQGISFYGNGWTIRSSNPNSDAIQIIGDASGTTNPATSLGINFDGTIESTGGGGVYILGKAGTASSYDHPFDVRGDVLANSGDILLVAENDVNTQTGLYFDTGANLGFKAATNVTASSSNVILKSDNTVFNASTPVNTSGAVSILPLDASTSFGVAQVLGSNLQLNASVSGLTVGKEDNTANITINTNQTIAGPISVYGGDISVNGNLETSSVSGGDILLKASGNITAIASKSITTDGGNVTLWSNSDSDGGYIYIQDNVTIDTRTASDRTANNGSSDDENGGTITLGGGAGTTTPTEYAINENTSFRGGVSLGTESGGQRHDCGISFISGGGNIVLKGQQTSTFGGEAAGISAYEGFVFDAGKTGNITLIGDVSGSSASYSDGMNLGNWATTAGGTASYIKTVNGDITLTGTSGSGSTQSRGVLLAGGGAGFFVQSTGTGIINVTGTSGGGAGTPYNILFIGANILANSGDINLLGGSAEGTIYSSFFASTVGYKSVSDITSSSSDITVTADKFDLTSGIVFNTSGTLTIKPTDGNSFTSTFNTSNLTYSSDVSSLTIGHSTNTGNITVGSSTTIAGPITIYGGDIAINAATTATGSDINLYASGAVTQSAAITANGLGLHGAGTFALTNASNNMVTLAGGNGVTALGSLSLVDASGGLTIGTVNSEDGLTVTGDVLVETLDGNINLTEAVTSASASNTVTGYTGAIVLNAGKNTAASTSTGGNIDVSGNGAVTADNGIVKLFSGSQANSTGLVSLVGGLSNTRGDEDENAGAFSPALTSGGEFAIFRACNGSEVTALSGTQYVLTGGERTFTITGDAGGEWTSDATGVATVDISTGAITGVTEGSADITYIVGNAGCTNSSAVRTINVSDANDWTGATDTDWNTAGNWLFGEVPTSAVPVVIPNVANQPVINENPGTPAVCDDLTIDASATLTIAAGKAFTVSGDIVNNGSLILQSDATGTATLVENGAAYSGSGNYTVQQYLAGGSRNYYLGSPVSGATGVVFDNTNESKFYHNATEQRYYTLADGDALNVLQGYVYRSADINTVEFTGALNTGALSNNSLPRIGTDNVYRGYNLVANPYPSFVDWTSITKTNLETSMWYRTYNGTSNVFDTYNATGSIGTNNNGSGAVTEFIPPMQAFWVRVNADGNTGQIAFDNTMRSHQTGILRAPQTKSVFRFVIEKDGQTDESVILFDINAQETVEDYDSRKMYSNVTAQVSTVVEGEDIVINGLPYADGAVVPTKVTLKEDGVYTLEATEQIGGLTNMPVTLEDKLTNTIVSFNAGEKYTFKGNTTDENRFVIRFGDIPLSTTTVTATAPVIFVTNNQITVKVSEVNNAELRIVNINGQLVQTQNINNSLTQINTHLPTGVYIVELNNGGELTREKVIIQ
jgi:hypothetical protein